MKTPAHVDHANDTITSIRSTTQIAGMRSAPPARGRIAHLPARIHLLGAGGAGLSGAARILLAHGHQVSGQDRGDSSFVEALRNQGMHVDVAPSTREHLPDDAELVVRSAAISLDDPQIVLALERGIPVLKYAELLGRLAPEQRTLGVAGTHGKTTTSWMCFHALRGIAEASGAAAPGALIGGTCRTVRTNAVAAEHDGWFTAEACEYDRSFLQLSPHGAVVTNVEADHLDYYGTLEAIEEAFARFVDRVHPDGLLVIGEHVPQKVEDAARCTVWRLGRELHVDLVGESHGFFRMRLRGPGWATPIVELNVPGRHNVDNAALALALAIGVAGGTTARTLERAADAAARTLHRYRGAERRFEPWGTAGAVEIVHDYAHHPTEVRVTLEAARRALPGKPLHVLFQPHQHSRTARFLDEFVESLRAADRVVVADVYGARAHIDTRGAGSAELVTRLRRAGVDAHEGGDPHQSVVKLCERLPAGSAALVLGAGDIDLVKDELLAKLALRGRPGR